MDDQSKCATHQFAVYLSNQNLYAPVGMLERQQAIRAGDGFRGADEAPVRSVRGDSAVYHIEVLGDYRDDRVGSLHSRYKPISAMDGGRKGGNTVPRGKTWNRQ
jgi:hypothetical protein